VRRLREDAAGAEYAAAGAALLKARQQVAEGEKALNDAVRWREEEEERRYRAALFTHMSPKALDAFKAGLAALREKEAALREELERREKTAEDAQESRDLAHTRLLRLRRDTEKINAHRQTWSAGEAREAQRLEDLEMEEFSGKKRGGEDEDEVLI
jgi:type III secretion protein O